MDLGISGRKAIVCGSSRGLGRAIAGSLARAGCVVVMNGIDAARLEAQAEALRRETGAEVVPVAADVTTRAGQDALRAAGELLHGVHHQLVEPETLAARQRRLALQGGPMSPDEAAACLDLDGAADAVRLRRWDDLAKDPDQPTAPFTQYRDLLLELVTVGR